MRGQSLLSLFSRDGPQELRLEVKSTQNLNSSLILHFLLTFDLYFFFPLGSASLTTDLLWVNDMGDHRNVAVLG